MSVAAWLTGRSAIRKDALTAMAVRVVGLALAFAVHVLLSRSLGANGYGRYAIVLGWALILVIPTRMGLDNAALKLAANYRMDGEKDRLAAFHRFSVLVMAVGSIGWAALATATTVISAKQAGTGVPWSELLAFAAMILPLALIGYYSMLLRTSGDILSSQMFEQVMRPVALAAGLGLAIWTTGRLTLNGALAMTAISLWIVLFAIVWKASKSHPFMGGAVAKSDRRAWLGIGGTMLAISAVQELMNQVDLILLGWAGQPLAAGLFSAAVRLSALIAFGLVAVGVISGSPIAIAHQQGDRAALQAIARDGALLATGFAIAIAVAINLLGPQLLVLFGGDFRAAGPALAILSVGQVLNAITGVVAYLMTMTGREKEFLTIVVVCLCLNVGLNLLLVPTYGATGAAVAAASALGLLNLLAAYRVYSATGINPTVFARSGG